MNAVVLDTNVLIDLFHDPDSFCEKLESFDTLLLPAIVVGEFRAGLSETKKDRAIEKLFSDYLKNPAVKVASLSAKTAQYYASIFRALKVKGHPIPQNDIWIAATALEHSTPLLTNDAHFSAIPMLQLV